MESKSNFRSNFIWNILGTGLNAFNSLFLLIAVTRINGINDAGIFSLAFSTACILYVIGTYAGRVFQVTDNDKSITNMDYVANRVITCVLMIICAFAFVLIKQYDFYKASIFILLALFKCLEAFSDVLYGVLQKNDLLNKVGKSYFIKGILSIITFIIVDLITKNIFASCISMLVIWICIIIFYDFKYTKKLIDLKNKPNIKNIIKIFKTGFFIFAITFLGLYIVNASKYAIDNHLTEDIQAIYGIIIMPATVMALVGQFLIHPYLNEITKLTCEKKIKELNKLVLKIIMCLVAFGVVASILAYFLGAPVLGFVYGIDLTGYELALFIIIIGSTLYNIGIIYSSVLVVIRKSFIQFIIYIVASIIAMISANVLTQRIGINGAVLSYFIVMLTYFIMYLISTNIILKRLDKSKVK